MDFAYHERSLAFVHLVRKGIQGDPLQNVDSYAVDVVYHNDEKMEMWYYFFDFPFLTASPYPLTKLQFATPGQTHFPRCLPILEK